jgi:hypothetical protein
MQSLINFREKLWIPVFSAENEDPAQMHACISLKKDEKGE